MALFIVIATLAVVGIIGTVITLGHDDASRLGQRDHATSINR